MFPLHHIAHVGISQSRGLKLFGREVILEEFQPMSSRYLIVTDGQTDRRTDESNLITALYALVHRAVKTRFESTFKRLQTVRVTNYYWQPVPHDWPGHRESSVTKLRPHTWNRVVGAGHQAEPIACMPDHCCCRGVQNRSGNLSTDVCGL